MAKITLVEMGLRDGLQNEVVRFDMGQKFSLFKKLCQSGLKRIELGAFVSPNKIPQMKDTDHLVRKVLKTQGGGRGSGVKTSALVPNLKGMGRAMDLGLKEVAVFGACTESFSKKISTAPLKKV